MKELLPCPLLLPNNNLKNILNKNHCNYSENISQKHSDDASNEDILVDIDSDPNYQKILIDFRKTMSKMI